MSYVEFVQKSPVERFLEVIFQNCFEGVDLFTPDQEKLLLAKLLELFSTRLCYRRREILKLRHGLLDGRCWSREEVAQLFKITRDRVRQIEAIALTEVRKRSFVESLCGALKENDFTQLAKNIEATLPTRLSAKLDTLSVRAQNALVKAGIFNVEQLTAKTPAEIAEIFKSTLNQRCVGEINDFLSEIGLRLKDN